LTVNRANVRIPISLLTYSVVLSTFRLEYLTPEDNSYGSEEGNLSWSGILGMVVKKEVEVGINMLEFASYRMEIVGFLPPIYTSK
jgi:hypothetical protein